MNAKIVFIGFWLWLGVMGCEKATERYPVEKKFSPQTLSCQDLDGRFEAELDVFLSYKADSLCYYKVTLIDRGRISAGNARLYPPLTPSERLAKLMKERQSLVDRLRALKSQAPAAVGRSLGEPDPAEEIEIPPGSKEEPNWVVVGPGSGEGRRSGFSHLYIRLLDKNSLILHEFAPGWNTLNHRITSVDNGTQWRGRFPINASIFKEIHIYETVLK